MVGENMLIPVEGHPGYFYMQGCPDGDILFPFWRDQNSSLPEGYQEKVLLKELMKRSEDIVDTNVLKQNFRYTFKHDNNIAHVTLFFI